MNTPSSDRRALKVLVVDDIEATRRALCADVRAAGHEAVEAASGREALARAQQDGPDLVLLDLLMPDLDGFEVTSQLRRLSGTRWLPVVVMSALEGEEHFIRALELGADDYLVRPVRPALLEAKLRHYARVLELQARMGTFVERAGAMAQRQAEILDNILDPVITLDADEQVIELNRAAAALVDRDGRPLTRGTRWQALAGPVPAAPSGEPARCRLRRIGGPAFEAEVHASEWLEHGQRQRTLILRDLTRQQELDQLKDEFLATVSHELRTPLTSIVGALGLLRGGGAGALPAPAQTLLEVAQRNGQRLGRLIDDILELAKLESDRLVLHRRRQPLAPLLREAVTANQGYAERAGVHLVAEGLDAPVPQASVDADRLLQALANLLSNAIKHSPAGETVRLTLTAGGPGARITVRDRGPGIDPQFRQRMFEKFSQADGSDRRAQGGTGLGLYITRMLVERMDGRVSADEVVGEGAAFTIELPATDGDAPATVVCHVDSDYVARQRVAGWLEPACTVVGAATLDQARAALAGREPALVIGNPQSQGAADRFCADLRRLAPGRPVLLLGDSVDQAFSAQVGLPWLSAAHSDPQALRDRVGRLIGRTPAAEGHRT